MDKRERGSQELAVRRSVVALAAIPFVALPVAARKAAWDTNHIYSVDITEYDPVRVRMVVRLGDLRARKLITETFLGDPVTPKTPTEHTSAETPPDNAPAEPAAASSAAWRWRLADSCHAPVANTGSTR